MITITQTCDGSLGDGVDCEETREIVLPRDEHASFLDVVAARGGWREVRKDTHLCPDCIKRALGG